MATDKFIIYQLLLRVFGNKNENCVPNGSFSFNGSGKFSSITYDVLERIKQLSVSYIWYTGVIEHATKSDFSSFDIQPDNKIFIKGEAGSPYAIKDYYDVNPYLADNINDRMSEFESMVDRTHDSGLKVIIDFVPNHVSRDYYSDSAPLGIPQFGENDDVSTPFSANNNFYYLPNQKLDLSLIEPNGLDNFIEEPCKVTGNDCFSNRPSINDWYETVKLNYGVDYLNSGATHFNPIPNTWNMMFDILKFWCAKGVDGFRCDMAEMVPVEFWEWCIKEIKKIYPDIIFIAEVYNPSLYDKYINIGGFDYLYDKVGMYDKLKFISQGNESASDITNVWQSLGSLQDKMLNFLENHDEQRIASDFNLKDPFLAIPELTVSLLFNKAPFMLYFGQEVGERGMESEGFSGIDGRTSIFDYCTLSSVVRMLDDSLYPSEIELFSVYKNLLSLAIDNLAFKSGLTYDLQYANLNNEFYNSYSSFVFARKFNKQVYIVTVDFSLKSDTSKIFLPKHFFDFWNILEREYDIEDITSDKKYRTYISANTPFSICFNKYGISILRICF